MKVYATHFVMQITSPFGDEQRDIKKVYELFITDEHREPKYIIERKPNYYDRLTQEEFDKLVANGLDTKHK